MKGNTWTPENDPLQNIEPGPPEKDPMSKWMDPEQFQKWAERQAAERGEQLRRENQGSLEMGRHGESYARAGAALDREANLIKDPILRAAYKAKAKELLNKQVNHR
jgi:hypothetical protein